MLADLIKLAYRLDKKGEYELASEVDKVVKELAQRAGLNIKDMVSLADYFDDEGETVVADKFDTMLNRTKKKV